MTIEKMTMINTEDARAEGLLECLHEMVKKESVNEMQIEWQLFKRPFWVSKDSLYARFRALLIYAK